MDRRPSSMASATGMSSTGGQGGGEGKGWRRGGGGRCRTGRGGGLETFGGVAIGTRGGVQEVGRRGHGDGGGVGGIRRGVQDEVRIRKGTHTPYFFQRWENSPANFNSRTSPKCGVLQNFNFFSNLFRYFDISMFQRLFEYTLLRLGRKWRAGGGPPVPVVALVQDPIGVHTPRTRGEDGPGAIGGGVPWDRKGTDGT